MPRGGREQKPTTANYEQAGYEAQTVQEVIKTYQRACDRWRADAWLIAFLLGHDVP